MISIKIISGMIAMSAIIESDRPFNHVVIQKDMIILFDDNATDKMVEELDTRVCYNAVTDYKTAKYIKRLIRRNIKPVMSTNIINHFFHRDQWSYNVVGHALYKNKPVQDYCERDELVVIESAR